MKRKRNNSTKRKEKESRIRHETTKNFLKSAQYLHWLGLELNKLAEDTYQSFTGSIFRKTSLKTGCCNRIHLCYMLLYSITTTQWWRRSDKYRRRKTSLTKYLPLTLLQGFEKGYSRFACERELETEHNWNILTLNLWPSTLCLSRSQILNRRSRGHSAVWWLSLRHLISVFSEPQLITAQRPLRPDVAFPTTSRLQLAATQLHLDSNSTELYNRSTPTRSLKSNV